MYSSRLASLASFVAICVAGVSLYHTYRLQDETRHLLTQTRSTLDEFQKAYTDQQMNLDLIREQVQKARDESVRLEREMSLLRDVARNAPPAPRDMPPVGPMPRAPAQEPEQLGGNVELKFGEHNAFLGLAFLPITEDWAREMKYPHKFGLRVERVVPGNAAEQAGIQRDDVVMKFNDRELRDTEELVKLMNDRRPGDTVGLLVFRQGKDIEVNVRLGAKRK